MRWLIALTMLAAPLATSTNAQQTGENTSIAFESALELETMMPDGKSETTRPLNLNRREKSSQTRVDDRTVKVECLASSLQRSGTDTPVEEKATALSGHAFLATKADAGCAVKDVEGGAPPNEGANL